MTLNLEPVLDLEPIDDKGSKLDLEPIDESAKESITPSQDYGGAGTAPASEPYPAPPAWMDMPEAPPEVAQQARDAQETAGLAMTALSIPSKLDWSDEYTPEQKFTEQNRRRAVASIERDDLKEKLKTPSRLPQEPFNPTSALSPEYRATIQAEGRVRELDAQISALSESAKSPAVLDYEKRARDKEKEQMELEQMRERIKKEVYGEGPNPVFSTVLRTGGALAGQLGGAFAFFTGNKEDGSIAYNLANVEKSIRDATGVDESTAGRVAGAIGDTLGLIVGPTGKSGLARTAFGLSTAARAAAHAYGNALSSGETKEQAQKSALMTAVEMAAFLGLAHRAKAGITSITGSLKPTAAPAALAVEETLKSGVANMAASGALRFAHGEGFAPTLESAVTDWTFAAHGGMNAFGQRRSSIAAVAKADAMRGTLFPEGATEVKTRDSVVHTATTSELFSALVNRQSELANKPTRTKAEEKELKELDAVDGDHLAIKKILDAKAKEAGIQRVRDTDRTEFEQAIKEKIEELKSSELDGQEERLLETLESQPIEAIATMYGKRLSEPVSSQAGMQQQPINVNVTPAPAPAKAEPAPSSLQDLVTERNKLVVQELPKYGENTDGQRAVQERIFALDRLIKVKQQQANENLVVSETPKPLATPDAAETARILAEDAAKQKSASPAPENLPPKVETAIREGTATPDQLQSATEQPLLFDTPKQKRDAFVLRDALRQKIEEIEAGEYSEQQDRNHARLTEMLGKVEKQIADNAKPADKPDVVEAVPESAEPAAEVRGSVFETTVRTHEGEAKKMFAVQRGENRGMGDRVFNTREQAEAFSKEQEADIKRAADKKIAIEKEAADKARAEAERPRTDIEIYTDGMPPMQRGKISATLSEYGGKRAGGKTYDGTRAQVTKQLLEAGYVPKSVEVSAVKELSGNRMNKMDQREQDAYEAKRKKAGTKTEYRLEKGDGDSVFTVTKAEHDYAVHLKSKEPAPVAKDEPARAGKVEQMTPEERVFYRGTVPGETKRIDEPFAAAKGLTFVARTEKGARQYGESVEKVVAKPDARILDDRSSDFWKVIGRKRPANGYIGSAGRKGESLVDVVNDAINKAKSLGYDAISIGDADIGTVILNENAFQRGNKTAKAEPAPVAKDEPAKAEEQKFRYYAEVKKSQMPLIEDAETGIKKRYEDAVGKKLTGDEVFNLATRIADSIESTGKKSPHIQDLLDSATDQQIKRAYESLNKQAEPAPVLRKGENQGDLLKGRSDDAFNLVGEKQAEPKPAEPAGPTKEKLADAAMRAYGSYERAIESLKVQAEADISAESKQRVKITINELERRRDNELRAEMEKEQMDAVREQEDSGGNELLSVLRKLGGLPLIGKETVLGGEFKRVFEMARGKHLRMKWTSKMQGKSLDAIRQELEGHGFYFETPVEMLEAIGRAMRGERIVGSEKPMEGGQEDLFNRQSVSEKAPENPMDVNAVKRATDALRARFKGAAETEIIADGEQFPDAVKERARKRGVELNQIGGVMHNGKVYLNAAGLESPKRAIEVFFHEQAGHVGVDALLDGLSPKSSSRLMDALRREFPAESKYAEKWYEPNEHLSEALARIMEKFGPESDATPQAQSRYRRVVDFIRTILAKSGIKNWSKNDIEALLRRGIEKVRRGEGKADKGDTKLSINDEPGGRSAWEAKRDAFRKSKEKAKEDDLFAAAPKAEPILMSSKNAFQAEEARKRGESPIESDFYRSNPEVAEAARVAMDKNPEKLPALIRYLLEEGRDTRKISIQEEAMLVHYGFDLKRQIAGAERIIENKNSTPAQKAMAEDSIIDAQTKMIELAAAMHASGEVWGAFGSFRQRIFQDDFSPAAMVRKLEKAKGKKLTDAEIEEIEIEAKSIEKTRADREKAEMDAEGIQRDDAAQDAFDNALKYHPKVLVWADEFVNRAVARGDAALARFKRKLTGTANISVDPTMIADLAQYAFGKIAGGSRDFVKFSAEVISEVGEDARKFLKPAWDKAQKMFGKSSIAKTKEKTPKQLEREATAKDEAESIEDGIKAVAKDPKALNDGFDSYVKKLANEYVRMGETTVAGVIAKLHKFFDPFMPDLTDNALKDAWTDYGKGKEATTDPTKRLQQQIRAEALLERQISDAEAALARSEAGEDVGNYLKLTGNQRVPLREQARLLRAQLGELKKKIPTPDITAGARRQSSLDAMETRARNRIAELRYEIAKGERTLKQKSLPPTSPKLEALRAELEEVQAEHLSVFGKRQMTEEQKLKLAIRSAESSEKKAIAELVNARKGIFAQPATKGVSRFVEVEAIRKRAEAARAETKALKGMDTAIQEAKKVESLESQIEKLESTLAEGKFAPKEKESDPTVETEAVTNLQAKRDALAAELAEKRKAARPVPDAELRELNRLESELASLMVGRAKPQKKMTVDTEQQAFAREQLAAKRAELAEIRANDDMHKIANRKAAILRQMADLADRTARGDFEPRKKKPALDISKDPDTMRLAAELTKKKADFARRVEKYRLANLTSVQRGLINLGKTWDSTRNLFLSFDFSAFLQTAAAAAAHPLEAGKALGKGVKAFAFTLFSDRYAHELQERARQEPLYKNGTFKKMGLEISETMGEAREENMTNVLERLADVQTRWKDMPEAVKKLIGMRGVRNIISGPFDITKLAAKGLGRGLKGSNVAFGAIAGHMRLVVAKSLLRRWFPDGNATDAQLKLLGKLANTFSGKGGIKNGGALNRLFFAPNYYLSIMKGLSGWDMREAAFAGEGKVTAAMAEEYVRAIATIVTVGSIAYLLGDRDEQDINPLDSDFGKFVGKHGTRTDLSMGRGAYVTQAARYLTGYTKEDGKYVKRDRNTGLALFLAGRFSREIKMATAILDGKSYDKKLEGPLDYLKESSVPLAWRDFDKVLEKEGITRGAFLQMLNLIGVTSRIEDEKKSSGSIDNMARKMKQEIIGEIGLGKGSILRKKVD